MEWAMMAPASFHTSCSPRSPSHISSFPPDISEKGKLSLPTAENGESVRLPPLSSLFPRPSRKTQESMPRRMNSFSAEKRRTQDYQAFFALGLLSAIALAGWCFPVVAPYCQGALQAAWSPLLIITLRYAFRVVTGVRLDLFAILDALAFIAATIVIPIRLFPQDVWHAAIILLCFVSTVWGVNRFRFRPLFMLLNCLVAGAILL